MVRKRQEATTELLEVVNLVTQMFWADLRRSDHAIAYLEQTEPGQSGGFGLPTPFMEWAVGKQGELMRPDTGKLLLPGSKFK